ncbi:MAG: prepilin-type N-terminal cleavage/methylation domain-containing protein [Armatimonadetes bacterium]|nr:prepilin-type N-terminal cleavage/methylation domain-containing protein [Armatimonadota bacterium]
MVRRHIVRENAGFTIIEIMIVILVVSILMMIAAPCFIHAQNTSRTKSCIENMKQIYTAKEQFAMENNKSNGDLVTWDDLVPDYIREQPECPAGGNYNLLTIGETVSCSITGHELNI